MTTAQHPRVDRARTFINKRMSVASALVVTAVRCCVGFAMFGLNMPSAFSATAQAIVHDPIGLSLPPDALSVSIGEAARGALVVGAAKVGTPFRLRMRAADITVHASLIVRKWTPEERIDVEFGPVTIYASTDASVTVPFDSETLLRACVLEGIRVEGVWLWTRINQSGESASVVKGVVKGVVEPAAELGGKPLAGCPTRWHVPARPASASELTDLGLVGRFEVSVSTAVPTPIDISRHRSAIESWGLAQRLLAATERANLDTPDVTSAQDPAPVAQQSEESLDNLKLIAVARLHESLPLPPDGGLSLLMWVECADARQCLLRALGRIKDADAATVALHGVLTASGIPQLAALVQERVPPSAIGFHSLCWTPCWATEAAEIGAAFPAVVAQREQFRSGLFAAIERAEKCDDLLHDRAQLYCAALIGQLPAGARFGPKLGDHVVAFLAQACEQAEPSDAAPQLALEIFAFAWNQPGALPSDAQDVRDAFNRAFMDRLERAVVESMNQQADRIAAECGNAAGSSFRSYIDRGAARAALSAWVNDPYNYLTAFPTDPNSEADAWTLLAKVEALIVKERFAFEDSLFRSYFDANMGLIDMDFVSRTAAESFQDLLMQFAAGDGIDPLFQLRGVSDESKHYPEPFTINGGGYSLRNKVPFIRLR